MRPLVLLSLVSALTAQEPGFALEPVVTGLQEACGMAFAPDGRLFVVERRTGNVVVVADGAARGPWATIPVWEDVGARGAIGIAVDPGFLHNGFVYVSHTTLAAENAIVRLADVGGQGTQPFLLPPRAPVSFAHNIGPMVFGADGKLYVLNGDAADLNTPQDLQSLSGKVWRVETPAGTVPSDNPFPGSYVFSYGHRNAFGIAVHPTRPDLYQTENGVLLDDEYNRLLPGRNYGWPMHDGRELTPDPNTEDPIHFFTPQTAPTGCAFASGVLYPPRFQDGWFVGDWVHGDLTFVDLDQNGGVRGTSLLLHFPGAIYAVADGPDGNLWVLHATSPGYGADSVSRVVYVQAPRPSLAMSAVSTIAVGGSLTLGATASNGDIVITWLGATRLTNGIPSPIGTFFVPFDAPLPPVTVTADARTYLALPVPDDSALRGAAVHAQAAALGSSTRLTNPVTLALR
ncbi:MAG: PQQ-dependent sugar dehydrogenase [Planctomycetota bacterium]